MAFPSAAGQVTALKCRLLPLIVFGNIRKHILHSLFFPNFNEKPLLKFHIELTKFVNIYDVVSNCVPAKLFQTYLHFTLHFHKHE